MSSVLDILNDQERMSMWEAMKIAHEFGYEELFLELELLGKKYPSKIQEIEREIMQIMEDQNREDQKHYKGEPEEEIEYEPEDHFSSQSTSQPIGLARCITKSSPVASSAYDPLTSPFKPVEFVRFADSVDN